MTTSLVAFWLSAMLWKGTSRVSYGSGEKKPVILYVILYTLQFPTRVANAEYGVIVFEEVERGHPSAAGTENEAGVDVLFVRQYELLAMN